MKNVLFIFGMFLIIYVSQGQEVTILLPPTEGASVSFKGVTQMGEGIHRFEVRRLGTRDESTEKYSSISYEHYVVYVAGNDYGPSILRRIDGITPLVVLNQDKNTIDLYYLAGANTHMRQKWRLVGAQAEFIGEKEIRWSDRPVFR